MSGIGTVVWKELRELYLPRGKFGRALWGGLAMTAFFGILLPIGVGFTLRSNGLDATAVAATIAGLEVTAGALTGYFVPITLAIDMTAGERERHTLETLLASPLRDRAIWGGKLLTIVLVASAQAGIAALLGCATAFVLLGKAGVVVLLAIPIAPVGAALLAIPITAVGIAIGSKALTVKSGQQTFGLLMVPFIFLIQFSLVGGARLLTLVAKAGPGVMAGFIAGAILLVAGFSGLALLWADRRCRRSRLLGLRD